MTREAASATIHLGLAFEQAEDRKTILGPGFRLTFSRLGERWSHALAIGHALTGVAGSVEGDPTRDDPERVVSPAYQDIQEHPMEGGLRVLLTGQSTPHHFSAVVTARREGDDVSVEFDVADRCRRPIATLAATYLIGLGSSALVDASPERVVWGADAWGPGRLEFSTDDPGTIALAEAGRSATRVQALARIVPSTATQRLFYRWRWTPSNNESLR